MDKREFATVDRPKSNVCVHFPGFVLVILTMSSTSTSGNKYQIYELRPMHMSEMCGDSRSDAIN